MGVGEKGNYLLLFEQGIENRLQAFEGAAFLFPDDRRDLFTLLDHLSDISQVAAI